MKSHLNEQRTRQHGSARTYFEAANTAWAMVFFFFGSIPMGVLDASCGGRGAGTIQVATKEIMSLALHFPRPGRLHALSTGTIAPRA